MKEQPEVRQWKIRQDAVESLMKSLDGLSKMDQYWILLGPASLEQATALAEFHSTKGE